MMSKSVQNAVVVMMMTNLTMPRQNGIIKLTTTRGNAMTTKTQYCLYCDKVLADNEGSPCTNCKEEIN